eukprot:4248253-Heterocapsa_arctica.AAC.1
MSSDDPPITGNSDSSRKTVAEYLEYLWGRPNADGNAHPGAGYQTNYFRWLRPPSWNGRYRSSAQASSAGGFLAKWTLDGGLSGVIGWVLFGQNA